MINYIEPQMRVGRYHKHRKWGNFNITLEKVGDKYTCIFKPKWDNPERAQKLGLFNNPKDAISTAKNFINR